MNTTENNKKLAEFLGLTIITDGISYFDKYFKHLKDYDKYWNSLMEVAEKIETVETKDGRTFTIDIHKDNVIINQYGKYNNEIIVTEGGTRIENLYKACIEFVEWYNKEQSNNTVINSLNEWVCGY